MAVVIGATGNLGHAVVTVLEEAGYSIDPTWTSEARPDATKADSYKELPEQIDLLVYLPGLNVVKDAAELSEEEWDNVMNVNLKGAFLAARAAFPGLKKSGQSTLVVISSIMTTHPYPKRLAYTTSKAALEGFTRALAVEWGEHGISSHCIRLGHLSGLMKSTPANPELLDAVKRNTPSGHLVEAKEVANYILWLAGGGSKAMNGTVVDFDPAYTINRWPLGKNV